MTWQEGLPYVGARRPVLPDASEEVLLFEYHNVPPVDWVLVMVCIAVIIPHCFNLRKANFVIFYTAFTCFPTSLSVCTKT